MGRVKLVVCDRDAAYLSSFGRFVRTSEYMDKVTLKCFTDEHLYRQFILSGETADLLLVAPEMVIDSDAESACGRLVLLLDNERMRQHADVPAVAKYRPLRQLLTHLLEMVAENTLKDAEGGKGKGKIVAVYSPSGGSGKTTVAFNLARSFARQHLRAVYLNMELHHAVPVIMNSSPHHEPSELVYHLKEQNPQLHQIIEKRKIRHPEFGFEAIIPPEHSDEWLEANEDDISCLFKQIAGANATDFLVADIDGAFHQALQAALKTADCVVWLLTPDPQSVWKTEKQLRQLFRTGGEMEAAFAKIRFVLNRSKGGERDDATPQISLPGKMPFPCILPEMERAPGAVTPPSGEPLAFPDNDLRALERAVLNAQEGQSHNG
ncbi:MAG TPA: hypothetical protein VF260_04500 [Bacilli bacterium]